MRNRPDSRGRLAGLTPATSPRPADRVPGDGVPGAGVPGAGGEGPEATTPRWLGAEPRYYGGWVPDVGTSLLPQDRPTPADDLPEPDDRPEPDDGPLPPITTESHRARRVRYAPSHAWGRVAQRWIPEPLRDARVDPGRRGALLLTVVAAVAALVAAVGVWRGQPAPRPVQAVSLAQVSAGALAVGTDTTRASTTGPTTKPLRVATSRQATSLSTGGSVAGGISVQGTSGLADGQELVVSVTGAVRHPGLVRLPPGSRVADAIAKAGGATTAADLTGINLAARLTDGASVVVSDEPSGGSGSSVSGLGSDTGAGSTTAGSGQPVGKVDLNTADAATLDALPGVGPVTAEAIVAWREKNGRYTSVEQLQEIAGIGPAKYAALAPLVTV